MEFITDEAARRDWQRRALAAWHGRAGEIETPTNTYAVEHEGRWYVALDGEDGLLAVYRVKAKADGRVMLQRMRRWPREVAPR